MSEDVVIDESIHFGKGLVGNESDTADEGGQALLVHLS